MTNNLDFGTTYGTMKPDLNASKLTVYGTTGTIPPNPARFPNAYLTAPIYDLSNNIVGPQGATKLNIYGSIFETRYPFTYIGTPAINNYGLFGQINQDTNSPKISIYQQVQGTLVYSYDYIATETLSLIDLATVTYLPIITGSALTIVNSNATKNGNRVTVTVNISYIDDGSNFGLSFVNCYIFYNTNTTSLSITNLTNMPLSRTGSQFANLTNISNIFSSNTVIPTILPNTSLTYCFSGCNTFNQNIGNWNTTNVTNMSYMFSECTAFNQNIGNWNTSLVQNMANMFNGCSNFNNGGTSIPRLSNWDTSQVTDMQYMFYNCSKFNGKILVNTLLVQNISHIFYGCTLFNNSGGANMLSSAAGSKTKTSTWTWTTLPTTYINWHGPINTTLGTAGYCGLTVANAPNQLTQLVNGVRTFI